MNRLSKNPPHPGPTKPTLAHAPFFSESWPSFFWSPGSISPKKKSTNANPRQTGPSKPPEPDHSPYLSLEDFTTESGFDWDTILTVAKSIEKPVQDCNHYHLHLFTTFLDSLNPTELYEIHTGLGKLPFTPGSLYITEIMILDRISRHDPAEAMEKLQDALLYERKTEAPFVTVFTALAKHDLQLADQWIEHHIANGFRKVPLFGSEDLIASSQFILLHEKLLLNHEDCDSYLLEQTPYTQSVILYSLAATMKSTHEPTIALIRKHASPETQTDMVRSLLQHNQMTWQKCSLYLKKLKATDEEIAACGHSILLMHIYRSSTLQELKEGFEALLAQHPKVKDDAHLLGLILPHNKRFEFADALDMILGFEDTEMKEGILDCFISQSPPNKVRQYLEEHPENADTKQIQALLKHYKKHSESP